MWEKMQIEGAIHLRSHSIPLNKQTNKQTNLWTLVPINLEPMEPILQQNDWLGYSIMKLISNYQPTCRV